MIDDTQTAPFDLVDFLSVAAGAACPPLFVIAIAQWIVRRNPEARQWVAQKAHRLAYRRIPDSLPAPSPTTPQEPAQNATAGVPMVDINTVASGDNILIIGGKGTGKTTLLETLIATRSGKTFVLDPHAAPGQWIGAYQVVGTGRNYEAIAKTLTSAHDWLSTRYRARSEGRTAFERITLVSDEFRSITQHLDSAGKTLTALLTEGRKVRLCCVLASHNDTVASLGVKGDKEAFVSSFDWIIYTGAFATKRLGPGPTIHHDTGDMPAFAYCLNVNEQRGYAFDLRSIAPPAAATHPPADHHETLLTTFLDTSISGGNRDGNEGDARHCTGNSTGNRDGNRDGNEVVIPGTEAIVPVLKETVLITRLLAEGKSANEITEHLTGSRNERLEKIRAVKAAM